ncbi:hypothetical protein SAMN04488109_5344 [Chryseolinea serpens]|uniref:Uncharacterized protein n=1 Tax=Chryseolinea serpens TaxID=947013 RepID=A0A1M5VRL7_9BACT|nr:hypothetical protein SAMN04488109_5344 [Chryseolinea serpens]
MAILDNPALALQEETIAQQEAQGRREGSLDQLEQMLKLNSILLLLLGFTNKTNCCLLKCKPTNLILHNKQRCDVG